MNADDVRILAFHGYVVVPGAGSKAIDAATFSTLLANIAHYGFALNAPAFEAVRSLAAVDVEAWWTATEAALRALTGADREMADHVVYKNFPAEVLNMSEADYWLRQILMYWGLPNELLRENEAPRAPFEASAFRVLLLGDETTLGSLYAQLVRLPSRWSDEEQLHVAHLAERFHKLVSVDEAPFRENRIDLVHLLITQGIHPELGDATDVLRLAHALSDGDVSLREKGRLRRFKRAERRQLLSLLEASKHLEADVGARQEAFKRLFHELRPGDYKERFPCVVAVYDRLYKGEPFPSMNRELEACLAKRDVRALGILATRPGEFMRRLMHALRLFGGDAAGAFMRVAPSLTNLQLLRLEKVLRTANGRRFRTFPPRGNWSKLQVQPVDADAALDDSLLGGVADQLAGLVAARVKAIVPTVNLDKRAQFVSLPTNDGDLAPYGRGTRFPIPESVDFIRTASYWSSGPTAQNVWYDNGWNFFDAQWQPKGAVCWNMPQVEGAAFSGDPTNSKDAEGRACQLIDLYPKKLHANGIRYAVWSLLCYSRKSFNEASEVFAALQWGEHAQSGGLFEPSRAQLAFPVRGAAMSKFIAYVDLERAECVYMDASLPARVSSAAANEKQLSESLPAFMEYLETLPSVYDLFARVPRAEDGVPVRYDDADEALGEGEAYVFKPTNEASVFTPLDLGPLLRLSSE
ncbi:MAG: hypothetical protein AAF645_11435 [Myxococcota bacterium]